ncbi:MAG: hypothetical protein PHS54_00500 [Clostridia bacterium]|nr:hypothetical protein [Clostridia bacterium]
MNDPVGKIRRDELEALGDLAEYVGGGLTEVVQSTTPGDRRNLFKNGNPDPRNVLSKALGRNLRAPRNNQQIPSFSPPSVQPQPPVPSKEPSIPHSVLPLTNEQLAALMQETGLPPEEAIDESTNIIPHNMGKPPIVMQHVNNIKVKPDTEQMEFKFVDQIIHPFGSVGDIINHFEERLDKLEQFIKLINSFMVENRENMKFIKDNMRKKRTSNQNMDSK